MKKIIRIILTNAFFWLLLGGLLLGSLSLIKSGYSKYVPERFIWTYTELSPTKKEFALGSNIQFYSNRWAISESRMIWEDYLYCESDEVDGIKVRRYKAVDSAIVKRGQSDGEWTFGESEFSLGYIAEELGQNCYIESRQEYIYNGQSRTQIFDSREIGFYFDIIE